MPIPLQQKKMTFSDQNISICWDIN